MNIINSYRGKNYINWGAITGATDDLLPLDCSPFVGGSLSVVRPSLDGTKIYVAGWTASVIHQLSSATPFDDINNYTQDSKTLNVTAEETSLRGFCFSRDGMHIYAVGLTSNTIFQYDLTVAGDPSTGSYSGKSLVLTGDLLDVGIKDDGTEIYAFRSGRIEAYPLSTANDISSAGSQVYSAVLGATNTVGFYINPNGRQIILTTSTTSVILKTWANAWDFNGGIVSSTVYTTPPNLTNVCVWSDGSKILTSNRTTNDVSQWSF